ncbi:DUF659 domain-containing protein [Mycena venus]|uniref:DUF659 domain-containing protein n=1 Tax=Mycena venus TaxID=2733690 RepID=A0A8H6Z3C9_9AGAR|nr:DUF659 domain-containing protein [Mycena venus]
MDVDNDSLTDEEPVDLLVTRAWFTNAVAQTEHIRGEKTAMIAHLITCPNASAAAKKAAKALKGGKKEKEDGNDDGDEPSRKWKRVEFTVVEKSMQQTKLKVFKGLNIPFSDAQAEIVRSQFLHATISTNLPFRWTVNPEVIKLFLLFRSTATDVMPSDEVISGRLLDEAAAKVDEEVARAMKDRYVTISSDGWKDKYSVTGVDITLDGKSYLVDLIHVRGKKKDGESMCAAFCDHIDKVERELGCIVGQLILLDYFRENEQAYQIAEDTTDTIGWINSHERVRDIFDDVQAEQNKGTVLSYLVANLMRWTTHSIAFNCLLQLKTPLRQASILRRDGIITAQVGAEKNRKKVQKMKAEANKFCDLLDNPTFWKNLQTVADDIEPICYITNINQGDKTRADQVLLGFAGIYLHFKRHSNPAVAAGMMARIEKRWAAMDQHFFIMAMVLNPFERVSRFGVDAGVSAFTLGAVLMELYKRVKSRPPPGSLTLDQLITYNAEKLVKEGQVSQAFLKYMSTIGVFADFEAQRADFEQTHYADLIENEEADSEPGEEHEVLEAAELERNNTKNATDDDGSDGVDSDIPCTVTEPPAPQRPVKWLPRPLSKLFAGKIPQPPGRVPHKAFTRQQLLMELLAAEHSEEEPDDGELEGSGDNYDRDD